MENLIPFKVRLATFEELGQDKVALDHNHFLWQLANTQEYMSESLELKRKMIPNPMGVALHHAYDRYAEGLSGEWIVVGKEEGKFYLCGQPLKVTRFLPIACCIFIGPLMPSNMQGLGI